MTTALDRAFVQAQIHTIRSLLESAAPNDFGGRMSLQAELADFEDRLEAMGHIVAWTGANAQQRRNARCLCPADAIVLARRPKSWQDAEHEAIRNNTEQGPGESQAVETT